MPLQLVLLIPFLRLGQWLFSGHAQAFSGTQTLLAQIEAAPWHAMLEMGGLFTHGLLAWLVIAVPGLALITVVLTPLMHKVTKLAATN